MNKKNKTTSPWLQLLKSSRPISWINTAFPFAAGYIATGGQINLYFLIATFYFLVPYNFLVYVVNDVFDYDSDMRNPRKNSIEGGLLPPETHRFMLAVTFTFNGIILLYLFVFGTLQTNLMLAAIVAGALSYSVPILRLKERPLLDSLNSSFHFVSPLVFALILTGWQNSYWPYVIAFFLWGCASHAFGAVQDILPDRAARISSIATYLGARNTVRLSLVLYLGAALLLAVCGWPAIVVCVPVITYIAMVLPYTNLKDARSEQANKGWRHFLLLNQFTGFVVTIVLIGAAI